MNEKDFEKFYEYVKNTIDFKSDKAIVAYMATHQTIIMQMYDEFTESKKQTTWKK